MHGAVNAIVVSWGVKGNKNFRVLAVFRECTDARSVEEYSNPSTKMCWLALKRLKRFSWRRKVHISATVCRTQLQQQRKLGFCYSWSGIVSPRSKWSFHVVPFSGLASSGQIPWDDRALESFFRDLKGNFSSQKVFPFPCKSEPLEARWPGTQLSLAVEQPA